MILDSAHVDGNGYLKFPKDMRKFILPKSPKTKHQLHQNATFSCKESDVRKIDTGSYQYIAYYDGSTRAAYLLETKLFAGKINYVEYMTQFGPKRTYVGYVGHFIKTGQFKECKRFE